MDADLMLRWMSETGSGRIRQLREHLTWLARTWGTDVTSAKTGRWMRELSGLAHAEVWWDQDRWATTPPVIARLPAADGTAIVVGARQPGMRDQLRNSDVSFHIHQPGPSDGDLPTPATWLVQFDDVASVQAVAARIGAKYVGCAARRLAARLPAVRLGSPTPPPVTSAVDLEHLGRNGQFARVLAGARADGLYRMRVHGRLTHRYYRSGEWFHCDRADGTFLDLAQHRVSALRWRSEGQNGRMLIGSVLVDRKIPLPALQARALTLCSGLAPRVSETVRTATYVNVPRSIVNQVAQSLHQNIEEIP